MSESINLTVLDELRALRVNDDPDPLAEIIDLFLEDGTERIKTIRKAAETNIADLIESTAHALKGAALNIGAETLANLCEDLSKRAREGQVSRSAELIRSVETEFTRAAEILRIERNK